ncbi:MAG TPA: hypothetical protein GXZ43_01595 [Clostridiaceae bacterium]|nr:hypothetical protein [Clostridiaceae bacterium]
MRLRIFNRQITGNKVQRISAVFCCFFISLLLLSGCLSIGSNSIRTDNTTKNKAKPPYEIATNDDGQITDISLLSALIDAINNIASVQEVYSAIPESGKTDLSMNDFSLYIEAISHPEKKEIIEFCRVPDDLKRQITIDISTTLSGLVLEAESTEYYELIFSKDTQEVDGENDQETEVVSTIIGIQHDAEGLPYLSASWIKEVNQIYEFSRFYFRALDDRDKSMLSWLLLQAYPEQVEDKISEIENNKAQLLIDYYRLSVETEPLNSVAHLLMPNSIEYRQELTSMTKSQKNFRTCTFKQNNNLISVSEPYPDRIKNQHLNLYYEDTFLLSWSSNGVREIYSSEKFNNLLGKPEIKQIEMEDPLQSGAAFWEIQYDQLTMIIKGLADPSNDTWSGIVEQFELNEKSEKLSLGSAKGGTDSLYYNMDLNDFYMNYPFSPESNYVIPGNQQGTKMELIVQAENSKITRIIIRAIYDQVNT